MTILAVFWWYSDCVFRLFTGGTVSVFWLCNGGIMTVF